MAAAARAPVVPRLKLGLNLGGVKRAEEVAPEPEAKSEEAPADDLDSMLAALGTPPPAKEKQTGYSSYFERKLAAAGLEKNWTAKYPRDEEQEERSFSPLSVSIAEERKAIEAERDDECMSPMEKAAQVIEEAAEEECEWSPTERPSLAERFSGHSAHHMAFRGGDDAAGLPEAPESPARGKWNWM